MWNGDDESKEMQDELMEKKKEDDRRHLTDQEKLLPDLVWKEVLGKLHKKDDIGNCSNASLYFGDLLREKRETKIVLPTVFGILGKRYCDKNNKDESYRETDLKNRPSKRPKNMKEKEPHRMTGFWKCRQVCKAWNQAIEELHRNEDAGHLFLVDEYFGQNLQLVKQWRCENFSLHFQVDKFVNHFEGTHYDALKDKPKKSPFLGRSVAVYLDNEAPLGMDELEEDEIEDEEQESSEFFFGKFIAMLEKYGEEIWYFKFDCTSEDVGFMEYSYWYQKLNAMLKLMPNLKALRISLNFTSVEDPQALEEEIGQNPLPDLPKLELISVYLVPDALFKNLYQSYRQIKALSFTNQFKIGRFEIFAENLGNLTGFEFKVHSVEEFEILENYQHPLNLIEFGLVFEKSVQFIKWSRVFDVIQSKINIALCKYLFLMFPQPTTNKTRKLVLEESLSYRLKFENVRCLWFLNENVTFGLDFLLPLKQSLQHLKIFCHPNDTDVRGRDKQVIQFLGNEDQMEKSNIRAELPNLKALKIVGNRFKVYKIESEGLKWEESFGEW